VRLERARATELLPAHETHQGHAASEAGVSRRVFPAFIGISDAAVDLHVTFEAVRVGV